MKPRCSLFLATTLDGYISRPDGRIDWLDEGCPIAALGRAWEVYAPQAGDYVTRALAPAAQFYSRQQLPAVEST